MPAASPTADAESLYAEVRPRLVRALAATAGSYRGVEDAVQEAFVALIRANGEEILAPAGWLYRVALRHLRRQQRRSRLAEVLLRRTTREDVSLLDQVVRRVDLVAILGRLPPRDRQLLVAKYYLGLTQEEIGAELGLPRGSVSAAIARATARLRREEGER